MPLDIQALGAELAGVIAAQMAPLVKRIEQLEARKSDGFATEKHVAEAVELCAQTANARLEVAMAKVATVKGDKGDDGKSVTLTDIAPVIEAAVARTALEFERRAMDAVDKAIDKIPTPKDGNDGVSFESFEMEYVAETHEVCVRATAAGRTKELRYPAGGIRPGGYWREGTKALGGQAWSEGGNLWIAIKDTSAKPAWDSPDWFKAASKGRDAEPAKKPPTPGTVALKG